MGFSGTESNSSQSLGCSDFARNATVFHSSLISRTRSLKPWGLECICSNVPWPPFKESHFCFGSTIFFFDVGPHTALFLTKQTLPNFRFAKVLKKPKVWEGLVFLFFFKIFFWPQDKVYHLEMILIYWCLKQVQVCPTIFWWNFHRSTQKPKECPWTSSPQIPWPLSLEKQTTTTQES